MKGKLIAGLGLIALLATSTLADAAECKVKLSFWSGQARQHSAAGLFDAKDAAFKTILNAANERRAEVGLGPWRADRFRVAVFTDGSAIVGMFRDRCMIADSIRMYFREDWDKVMKGFKLTLDDFLLLEDGDNPISGTSF